MRTGTKKKKEKIDKIRSAPELLRIDARYPKAGPLIKFFLILLFVLLFAYHKDIINMIKEKSLEQQLALSGMLLFFMAFLVFTIYIINRLRGKTLIVTEKGLFIDSLMAEFWKNIDEYRWNSPKAGKKVFPPGNTGEQSLFLFNNKGAWPKVYDLTRYGIFFTSAQVQQIDDLCRRLEVKKSEG